MTSSRTGQSPNVDATHSLWRMSVPPRRITDALPINDAAYLGANVFAVQIAAGYVSLSKLRGFDAPLMFAVRFSNINRVCASQGRSHKRSEVVVVTPYGCTRVCSSSVNADLRASYQAKAPNATDTTAAMANNIHIAGFFS
jgi:hypothetical protein